MEVGGDGRPKKWGVEIKDEQMKGMDDRTNGVGGGDVRSKTVRDHTPLRVFLTPTLVECGNCHFELSVRGDQGHHFLMEVPMDYLNNI